MFCEETFVVYIHFYEAAAAAWYGCTHIITAAEGLLTWIGVSVSGCTCTCSPRSAVDWSHIQVLRKPDGGSEVTCDTDGTRQTSGARVRASYSAALG